MKLFVVDNDDVFYKILKHSLSFRGLTIEKIGSMNEAKTKFNLITNNKDIWFIHSHLKELNNPEDLGFFTPKNRCIILTSSHAKIEASQFLNAGFENILQKPYPPDKIQKIIKSLHEPDSQDSTQPPSVKEIQGASIQDIPDDGPRLNKAEIRAEIRSVVTEYLEHNLKDLLKKELKNELNEIYKLTEDKPSH